MGAGSVSPLGIWLRDKEQSTSRGVLFVMLAYGRLCLALQPVPQERQQEIQRHLSYLYQKTNTVFSSVL